MSKTTIEFNGQRFDAKKGVFIDGIIRNPRVQPGSNHLSLSPKLAASGHSLAAHASKHQPQKARTLSRSAVRPPEVKKIHHNSKVIVSNQLTSGTKATATYYDKERYDRANQISRSQLVSRFSSAPKQSSVVKRVSPLEVATQPLALSLSEAVFHPTDTTVRAVQKSDNFAAAIEGARSHEQKHLPKPAKRSAHRGHRFGLSRRATGLSSAIVAVVALIGFLAYQKLPNLQLHIAATKAGVSGGLPTYRPAGFAIGGISPSAGQIVISFRSNTNQQTFSLSEQKSAWNSEALLANYVADNNRPYQTYQEEGKTIYIYEDNHASWVDGGMWYKIEGDAHLSSDQLLRMARSL